MHEDEKELLRRAWCAHFKSNEDQESLDRMLKSKYSHGSSENQKDNSADTAGAAESDDRLDMISVFFDHFQSVPGQELLKKIDLTTVSVVPIDISLFNDTVPIDQMVELLHCRPTAVLPCLSTALFLVRDCIVSVCVRVLKIVITLAGVFHQKGFTFPRFNCLSLVRSVQNFKPQLPSTVMERRQRRHSQPSVERIILIITLH